MTNSGTKVVAGSLLRRRELLAGSMAVGLLALSSKARAGVPDLGTDAPGLCTPCSTQDPLRPFEDEMVAHSRWFAPMICDVIGETQLRSHLRSTVDRCAAHRFTFRGPIRTVIEMTFLFGTSFDSDPQFPWAAPILNAPAEQMERAEQLYRHTLSYRDAVSRWSERRALARWLTGSTPSISQRHALPDMLRHISRIFPEKAAYVGEQGLASLVSAGIAEGERLGFPTPQGQLLVVASMFALGHGCIRDPLLPMVRQSLESAQQLEPLRATESVQRQLLWWTTRALAQ